MADAPVQSPYTKAFIKHICSICKLCDSNFPGFCMTMYGGNPSRFLDILKYVNALRVTQNDEVIDSFYTFEGFCGLFCNSQAPCPVRTEKCKRLIDVFYCYTSFANQCGASLDLRVKANIYKDFSGIETRLIGHKPHMTANNILKTIAKKKRKKINHSIKKAKACMKRDLQITTFLGSLSNTKTKKKSHIETTFFYNDNEEWERMINSYLDSETNNRQSTTTT